MKPIDRLSPNYDGRNGRSVDMLVFHYTGMPTAEEALRRMCDPEARVSAHYCIDEEGRTYRLVPEAKRAWHAGESRWAGETDINACSVGIELVNPGHEHGYRDFPLTQIAAAVRLAKDIVQRHAIRADRVVGHSDIAPARKQDPGELFDWQRLSRAGIGLWPGRVAASARPLAPGEAGEDVAALQAALAGFGYGIADTGVYDDQTTAVVAAFQRHFRQQKVDGVADAQTRALIDRLAEQVTRLRAPSAG